MKQFLITSGSHLYGTARPDSDLDIRGVYLESQEQILGLHEARTIEKKDPDFAIHPLKKFIYLALQGNPNILEILFADKKHWHTSGDEHDFFETFIAERHRFLSQRCKQTYMGYAYSQLKKIDERKSPTRNTRSHLIDEFGYDTKYAAHTARLLMQGQDIWVTGNFNPTLEGTDLETVRDILAGKWKKEEFIGWAEDMMLCFDTTGPVVPKKPNTDFIEGLLVSTYRAYL